MPRQAEGTTGSLSHLNWGVVRNLAQFQLLNRVSMLTLILVPILASVWTVVPFTIAAYNGSMLRLEATLDRAVHAIKAKEVEASKVLGENRPALLEGAEWAQGQLQAIRIASRGHLPSTFAALFFAALAVLAGRSIFDLAAPEVVRHATRERFIEERQNAYRDSQSRSALERAMAILGGSHDEAMEELRYRAAINAARAAIVLRVEEAKTAYEQAKCESHTRFSDLTEAAYRQLKDAREELAREDESQKASGEGERQRRSAMVEAAARREYAAAASSRSLAILGAAVCYMGGLALLVFVIANQSIRVAMAAGWMVGKP